MKIHTFALRWRDEIKGSSQLRTLLKRVVVNWTWKKKNKIKNKKKPQCKYMNFHISKIIIYLISLSILITCLLDNVWILLGDITFGSLQGVKGLNQRAWEFPSQNELLWIKVFGKIISYVSWERQKGDSWKVKSTVVIHCRIWDIIEEKWMGT